MHKMTFLLYNLHNDPGMQTKWLSMTSTFSNTLLNHNIGKGRFLFHSWLQHDVFLYKHTVYTWDSIWKDKSKSRIDHKVKTIAIKCITVCTFNYSMLAKLRCLCFSFNSFTQNDVFFHKHTVAGDTVARQFLISSCIDEIVKTIFKVYNVFYLYFQILC